MHSSRKRTRSSFHTVDDHPSAVSALNPLDEHKGESDSPVLALCSCSASHPSASSSEPPSSASTVYSLHGAARDLHLPSDILLSRVEEWAFAAEAAELRPHLRLAFVRAGERATLASVVDSSKVDSVTVGELTSQYAADFRMRVVALLQVQCLCPMGPVPVVATPTTRVEEVTAEYLRVWRIRQGRAQIAPLSLQLYYDADRTREANYPPEMNFFFFWALLGMAPVLYARVKDPRRAPSAAPSSVALRSPASPPASSSSTTTTTTTMPTTAAALQMKFGRLEETDAPPAPPASVDAYPPHTETHLSMVIQSHQFNEVHFRVKRRTPFSTVSAAYCRKVGFPQDIVRFICDGRKVDKDQPVEELRERDVDGLVRVWAIVHLTGC